jgi:hypothetical protein
VIDRIPAQSELLEIWERGAGEGVSGRALALAGGAAPGISGDDFARMPVGRRDAALIELRQRLFGDHFTGITSCPSCGEEIELTFEASEVRREAARIETATVVAGEYEIDVRLPSSADLAAIEPLRDLAAARTALLERCITRAPLPLEAMPPEVIDAIAERMSELDPQADVSFDVDCPSCAHAWREPFDVVTFLWTELSAWARRLLADVHTLASAYGWSERDILGLSPVRRAAYIEMLQ